MALWALSLLASVRVGVSVREPRDCPRHNSAHFHTRITKFGPEI